MEVPILMVTAVGEDQEQIILPQTQITHVQDVVVVEHDVVKVIHVINVQTVGQSLAHILIVTIFEVMAEVLAMVDQGADIVALIVH